MYCFQIISLFLLANVLSQVQAKNSGFKAAKTGASAGDLAKELALLGIYGSRRGVTVKNNAKAWLRIWCASKDDSTGEQRLNPGQAIAFAFKPKVIGGYTVFWCTLDYKGFWARFDVFGQDASYGFDNKYDKVYDFSVQDDGVYYKGKKIRGLTQGKNKYVLWEHYSNNRPHGAQLKGFVDKDMCNNIPGWMERKASAVTVCDNQCVILFRNLHCTGERSRLQAKRGCTNFRLGHFNDKARSVKGC